MRFGSRLVEFIAAGTGAVILVANFLPFLALLRHRGAMRWLSQFPPSSAAPLPRLSVIIPARDEERGLRAALESVLAQDYPDLELIVVDDRSADGTAEIAAALATEYPGRMRVITVRDLPPHWLGKNHALWLGAQAAGGAWLLFTDADIVFDPTCCRRAVAYAEAYHLDHLTLAPRVLAQGYWLTAFVDYFTYAFVTFQRLYLAPDPASKVGVGLGAFNLIRRSAYHIMGTHAAISLRPDDDMRLGQRVKLLGLRQDVLGAQDLLEVDWYPSVPAAVRGLEKNSFAAADYDLGRMLATVAFILLTTVLPVVAVWRAGRTPRRLLAGAIAAQSANYIYVNREARRPAQVTLPVLPLTALLFCYTFLRSTLLALRQGGIRWRGTLYPLDELRSQTGLEREG